MVKSRTHVGKFLLSFQMDGKAYGLEVDPWAAVEPVPYLCAVNLTLEYSEPKHVSKGHCTHTLKLRNSGTFAHQNRFSILASDEGGNSLGDCDVAKHVTNIKNWKTRGERDDEFSCCEERVDACLDPEMNVPCQRKVNAFTVKCSPSVVLCEIRGG